MSDDLVNWLRSHGSVMHLECASAIERLTAEVAALKTVVQTLRTLQEAHDLDVEVGIGAIEAVKKAIAEAARLREAMTQQVKQYPDYSDICAKALRAGGRVMEWRDISTAPKDGTVLLLWVPSGGWYPGSFNKYSGRWDDGDYFDDLRPTHWMPIPQPPQGSEG